jgi:hypothetical protein
MKDLEDSMQPKIEAWIMRNNELETRLADAMTDIARFPRVMRDLMKTIAIKDKQLRDSKALHDSRIAELESFIAFLQVELENRGHLLTAELFPRTQEVINGQLSLSHEKLQSLSNRVRGYETENGTQREKLGNLMQE